MTYEQAVYFKLLILCGYFDEYEQFLDHVLEKQELFSDVVVDLAFCGSDRKRVISVLTSYISGDSEAEIDYDGTVFCMLLSFFRCLYTEKRLSLRELTELMTRIAYLSGRYFEEPWQTMYLMEEYLTEAEWGLFQKSMDQFRKKIERFLIDGNSSFQ